MRGATAHAALNALSTQEYSGQESSGGGFSSASSSHGASESGGDGLRRARDLHRALQEGERRADATEQKNRGAIEGILARSTEPPPSRGKKNWSRARRKAKLLTAWRSDKADGGSTAGGIAPPGETPRLVAAPAEDEASGAPLLPNASNARRMESHARTL